MFKTFSEVVIRQQPWMKGERQTRITIKDYQTNELNRMRPLITTVKG